MPLYAYRLADMEFSGWHGSLQGPGTGGPRESVIRTQAIVTEYGTDRARNYARAYEYAQLYRSLISPSATYDLRLSSGLTIAVQVADCVNMAPRSVAGGGALLEAEWRLVAPITWLDGLDAGTIARPTMIGLTLRASIGSTLWSHHRGAVVPPALEVLRTPLAGGGVRLQAAGGPAQYGESTITTHAWVDQEEDCLWVSAACAALVGTDQTIIVSGVTCTGVPIRDCTVHHTRVRGGPKAWLVEAVWQVGGEGGGSQGFDRDAYKMLVDTATVWGEWTERSELACSSVMEALGPAIGSTAVFYEVDEDDHALDLVGQYVRVRVADDPDDADTTHTAAWWGVITGREIGTQQGVIMATYQCRELLHILQQVMLPRWYEVRPDGTVVDPGEMLAINAVPSGERSTEKELLGTTHTAYVHERSLVPGLRWRASHFVEALLDAIAEQLPQGPRWELAGLTDALGNQVPVEWEGLSVLEAITRSLGGAVHFRAVPQDDLTVQLQLCTGQTAAITVGDFTLPASTRQETIDLTGDDIVGWEFVEDAERQADGIYVECGRPHGCISLIYDPSGTYEHLIDGWTSAAQAAWEVAEDIEKSAPDLAMVYRRFVLPEDWGGARYGGVTAELPVTRDTVTDALHGTGGENGTFTAGGDFSPRSIRFTPELPITQGPDWTDGDPEYIDFDERLVREVPQVYVVADPGTPSESWATLGMDITVEPDRAAVILGRDADDAAAIKAHIDAGSWLLFTLGFTWPVPWRVSWRRATASRPRDQERVVRILRPDLTYRIMMGGAVLGLDADGAPREATAGWIGGPPSDQPDEYLALMRTWFESPARDLSWARDGILDTDATYAPGTLVTTATVGLASAITANALLQQRVRNCHESSIGTTYSATTDLGRVIPDLEDPAHQVDNLRRDLADLVYPAGA